MHIERGRYPLDGHIPEELITKIKGTQDIVEVISRHVSLKKSGQNYSGLCPFHSEKTPSFVVSPAKQLFHCFGCGTGGNVITFLMKYENVTFPEVLKNLARDAGIAIPSKSVKSERKEESLYEVNRLIAEYYNKILLTYKEAGAAREYLLGRGLSTEVIERFNVGYSINSWNNVYEYLRNKGFKDEVLVKTGLVIPKNSGAGFYDRFRGRIMFPIHDTQGRVVGFGGRVLDDSTPKYLNSPETPLFNKGALLYGLNIAKDGVRESGYAIIVEGYMDVIAVCQSGIPNVVGTLGTALTVNHLRVLNRFCKEVILTFDPDIAGRNAALRTVDIFIESGIRGKVLILPEGEDPDIFIRKRGKGQFLELIERSKGIFDFSLDHIIGKSGDRPDKGSIEKKVSVTEECFELIRKIPNRIEQDYYLEKVSKALAVEKNVLMAEFRKKNKNKKGLHEEKSKRPVMNRPVVDEILCILMIRDKSFRKRIKGNLSAVDFVVPEFQEIAGFLIDSDKDIDVMLNSDDYNQGVKDSVTRLACSDLHFDSAEQTFSDCVRVLQRKRLEIGLREVEKEIGSAEMSGTFERVRELLFNKQALLKQKRLLYDN